MNDEPTESRSEYRVTGAGNIVLGGVSVSPNDPVRPENTMAITAIRRARMYESAMATLMDAEPDLSIPIAHLAGFAVEVGLKGYLLRSAFNEAQVVKFGHNLENVWRAAHTAGMGMTVEPPHWLRMLNDLHKAPYYLRYPHRTCNGFSIPNKAVLRHGIAEILGEVEVAIDKIALLEDLASRLSSD